MKKRTLRLLACGYGQLGAHLVGRLAAEPGCEIAAVAEPAAAARARAAERYRVFDDFEAALAATEADAALINTPAELHYAQARAALERGLHVLVAKPVATRLAEAKKLVALAERRGRTLAVGQQMRYNRHYRALAAFLESGELGRVEMVHFLNSKPRPQPANLATMAQPALLEMACHHFDALFALFPQARAQSIVADGFRPSWSAYRGACMVNALIRLDEGVRVQGVRVLYHAGFSAQADCYELRLEGTRGALRCRGVHMSADEMRYELAPSGGRFEPRALDAGIAPASPWDEFFARWRAWLDGGEEPPFSGRNNLKVFALLCAGIRSAESGRRVKVS